MSDTLYAVVRVDNDYDYVEGAECVAVYRFRDEADSHVRVARTESDSSWMNYCQYNKDYADSIKLPETDYQGWLEFLKQFNPFGIRYVFPKDFHKELASYLNSHGSAVKWDGYKPPKWYPRLNLFVIEVRKPMSEFSFNEYQRQSRTTARYPDIGSNYVYPVLGLCGEAGEVSEKIKKLLRDKGGVVDDAFREAAKKELGDVLWYHAQLCSEFGFTMEEVAKGNLDKLFGRVERGTIHGSGDNR